MAAVPAFSTFEQKWLDAHPEYAIASVFLPAAARSAANAFGCLVDELDAASQLRDPQVAAAKVAWWYGEITAALRGHGSHPVTQALFTQDLAEAGDAALWQALADAMLRRLDRGSASTLSNLLAQHADFHMSVARIDAALQGKTSSGPGSAALWTISLLLRQLAHLDGDDERLSLPLDLLARHGLTRAQLSATSAARHALLRDYLDALAGVMVTAVAAPLSCGLYVRVRTRLDRALIAAARAAPDPLAYAHGHLRARRWQCLWAAWREARAQVLDG